MYFPQIAIKMHLYAFEQIYIYMLISIYMYRVFNILLSKLHVVLLKIESIFSFIFQFIKIDTTDN